MINYTKKSIILFWKKVKKIKEKDECWLWIACKDKNGYGKVTINRKDERAHRLSWKLHYGDIPENHCVCHHCDNPSCVNPKHLFIGTIRDNNTDKTLKGRSSKLKEENNPTAKLTKEDVLEIRKWAHNKIRHGIIAYNFGVKKSYISNIVQRKTWKDI